MGLSKEASEYLAAIGRRGGKAGTGKAKARTKAQARKAANARWENARTKKSRRAATVTELETTQTTAGTVQSAEAAATTRRKCRMPNDKLRDAAQ